MTQQTPLMMVATTVWSKKDGTATVETQLHQVPAKRSAVIPLETSEHSLVMMETHMTMMVAVQHAPLRLDMNAMVVAPLPQILATKFVVTTSISDSTNATTETLTPEMDAAQLASTNQVTNAVEVACQALTLATLSAETVSSEALKFAMTTTKSMEMGKFFTIFLIILL